MPEVSGISVQCPSCSMRWSSNGDDCSWSIVPSSPLRRAQSTVPVSSSIRGRGANRDVDDKPLCRGRFSLSLSPLRERFDSIRPSAIIDWSSIVRSSFSSSRSSLSNRLRSVGLMPARFLARMSFKMYKSTSSGHFVRGLPWVRGLRTYRRVTSDAPSWEKAMQYPIFLLHPSVYRRGLSKASSHTST